MARRKLCIVTPIFNDWPSFRKLIGELDKECAQIDWDVSVLAIDDGSTDESDTGSTHVSNPANLRNVEVVTLAANLGHQSALAVGLSVAVNETDAEAVI